MTSNRVSNRNECTPWFPESVRPIRVGAYQIHPSGDGILMFAYWSGFKWGWRMHTPKEAYEYRDGYALGPITEWRGLAKKPKEQCS